MRAGIAILLLVAVVVLASSAFIVKETEQVFVTQFGRPVRKPITEPGMHFKVPFIQTARFFDKRFLEWDGNPNQVPTRDKRYISIDAYARWRISDPLVFFQKVGDEMGAQTRLDDVLDGAMRNAVARHDLVEIVRSGQRDSLEESILGEDDISVLSPFQYGRARIARDVLESASPQLRDWGIELLDIRFKRINYEEGVKQKIFERMISERERIADKFRSEGQGEAAKIQGQRERDLKTIQSEAYRKVQEIQGAADAEAVRIYADAYNQNPSSREFYQFLKSMETYDATLSSKDWLVLSTRSTFFQYLNGADAASPPRVDPQEPVPTSTSAQTSR